MALAQRRVFIGGSWPDDPDFGKHFLFVPGIGSIFERRVESIEACFLCWEVLWCDVDEVGT